MLKKCSFLIGLFTVVILVSCSKKTHPGRTTEQPVAKTDTGVVILKTDSLGLAKKSDSVTLVKKPAKKSRPKSSVPTVITVNDNVARKSVDGRLYYDLQGHRYWRSNKDGKYYLFNKSMQSDPAFSKPQQQP